MRRDKDAVAPPLADWYGVHQFGQFEHIGFWNSDHSNGIYQVQLH